MIPLDATKMDKIADAISGLNARLDAMIARRDADFDASKHPRANDGKFGSGGGGGGHGGSAPKTANVNAKTRNKVQTFGSKAEAAEYAAKLSKEHAGGGVHYEPAWGYNPKTQKDEFYVGGYEGSIKGKHTGFVLK
jgi:hypothetical protein